MEIIEIIRKYYDYFREELKKTRIELEIFYNLISK